MVGEEQKYCLITHTEINKFQVGQAVVINGVIYDREAAHQWYYQQFVKVAGHSGSVEVTLEDLAKKVSLPSIVFSPSLFSFRSLGGLVQKITISMAEAVAVAVKLSPLLLAGLILVGRCGTDDVAMLASLIPAVVGVILISFSVTLMFKALEALNNENDNKQVFNRWFDSISQPYIPEHAGRATDMLGI